MEGGYSPPSFYFKEAVMLLFLCLNFDIGILN